jgi:hypothetical protein
MSLAPFSEVGFTRFGNILSIGFVTTSFPGFHNIIFEFVLNLFCVEAKEGRINVCYNLIRFVIFTEFSI